MQATVSLSQTLTPARRRGGEPAPNAAPAVEDEVAANSDH